jgi:hypothetical protein
VVFGPEAWAHSLTPFMAHAIFKFQVVDWLVAMGLAEYAEHFERQQISGDVLLDLTVPEIREVLGITRCVFWGSSARLRTF